MSRVSIRRQSADWRRYRGIALGHPVCAKFSPHVLYRWRCGRVLTISTARHLPRDWMRNLSAEASQLRKDWLAAPKGRT